MVLQGQVTNQIHYITITSSPMVIKLGKVASHYKGIPCIKSYNPLNIKSSDRLGSYISTTTKSLAIKRGKVTHYDGR